MCKTYFYAYSPPSTRIFVACIVLNHILFLKTSSNTENLYNRRKSQINAQYFNKREYVKTNNKYSKNEY